MDTRHLIDAVVQQTTVLIAQLATRAGIRAPMAHIADQIFLELLVAWWDIDVAEAGTSIIRAQRLDVPW